MKRKIVVVRRLLGVFHSGRSSSSIDGEIILSPYAPRTSLQICFSTQFLSNQSADVFLVAESGHGSLK